MIHPINPVERIHTLEAGGFRLTEFAQPPALKIPRHAHSSAMVLLVLEGAVSETYTRRAYECLSFSLLIRPAEETHSHDYGRMGAHCIAVEVSDQRRESLASYAKTLDRVSFTSDGAISSAALRIHRELRLMDQAAGLAVEGLMLETLSIVARDCLRRLPKPRWLGEARDLLRECYKEPLSLAEIAQTVGVNATHLAATFHRHYRCTVGEYVRRLRLNHAAAELMHSERPLAEIAVEAGFYDQSHFTRAFKHFFGTTPSEIRSLARIPKARTKNLHSYNPRPEIA
ncbi:MAG: AraC family transcriptional regulator [Acidobacteriota bacterium]